MGELTPDKQLLSWLAQKGIGHFDDIIWLLDVIYPAPSRTEPVNIYLHGKKVYNFLMELEDHGFITLDIPEIDEIKRIYKDSKTVIPHSIFNYTIKAGIRKAGIEYVNQSKDAAAPFTFNIEGDNTQIIQGSPHAKLSRSTSVAKSRNETSDTPSKIKKWFLLASAAVALVLGIFKGWLFLREKVWPDKSTDKRTTQAKAQDTMKIASATFKDIRRKDSSSNHPVVPSNLSPNLPAVTSADLSHITYSVGQKYDWDVATIKTAIREYRPDECPTIIVYSKIIHGDLDVAHVLKKSLERAGYKNIAVLADADPVHRFSPFENKVSIGYFLFHGKKCIFLQIHPKSD